MSMEEINPSGLWKDTIVFAENGEIMSVGMLSQTTLEAAKAECVVAPISLGFLNAAVAFWHLKDEFPKFDKMLAPAVRDQSSCVKTKRNNRTACLSHLFLYDIDSLCEYGQTMAVTGNYVFQGDCLSITVSSP